MNEAFFNLDSGHGLFEQRLPTMILNVLVIIYSYSDFYGRGGRPALYVTVKMAEDVIIMSSRIF